MTLIPLRIPAYPYRTSGKLGHIINGPAKIFHNCFRLDTHHARLVARAIKPITDAVADLGRTKEFKTVFKGFQRICIHPKPRSMINGGFNCILG
jgi:hypothetical protein